MKKLIELIKDYLSKKKLTHQVKFNGLPITTYSSPITKDNFLRINENVQFHTNGTHFSLLAKTPNDSTYSVYEYNQIESTLEIWIEWGFVSLAEIEQRLMEESI